MKKHRKRHLKWSQEAPEEGALTHHHSLHRADSNGKRHALTFLDRKALTFLLQQKEDFSSCLATDPANEKAPHFEFQVSSNGPLVYNSPSQLPLFLYAKMPLSFVLWNRLWFCQSLLVLNCTSLPFLNKLMLLGSQLFYFLKVTQACEKYVHHITSRQGWAICEVCVPALGRSFPIHSDSQLATSMLLKPVGPNSMPFS